MKLNEIVNYQTPADEESLKSIRKTLAKAKISKDEYSANIDSLAVRRDNCVRKARANDIAMLTRGVGDTKDLEDENAHYNQCIKNIPELIKLLKECALKYGLCKNGIEIDYTRGDATKDLLTKLEKGFYTEEDISTTIEGLKKEQTKLKEETNNVIQEWKKDIFETRILMGYQDKNKEKDQCIQSIEKLIQILETELEKLKSTTDNPN